MVVQLEVLEWHFRNAFAVAAHDASTHLTERDEPVAVETRGGAEVYMETLCDVLGLGCQWADFAEDMCMMMFGRALSQNGEIERASRCRGMDMVTEASVSVMR